MVLDDQNQSRYFRPAPIRHPVTWHIRNAIYMLPVITVLVAPLYLTLWIFIAGLPDFPIHQYIDARVDLFFRAGSRIVQAGNFQYVLAVNQFYSLDGVLLAACGSALLFSILITWLVVRFENTPVVHRGQTLNTAAMLDQLRRK